MNFKSKVNIAIVLSLLMSFCAPDALKAQEIDPTININMEPLAPEAKIFVSTLERDLTNYLKTQRFIDKDWIGPKIPVNISIYLSGGSNGRFSAKLIFVSSRYIKGSEGGVSTSTKFFLENWSFEYNQGGNFAFNPLRCDKFLSMIDFYTLLAIGYDCDTYEELGGTRYYDLARQVASNCRDVADGWQTFSQPGEFTRHNLITEMLDPKFEQFRSLLFSYHVDGLDMLASDKETGGKNIETFVNDLADFKQKRLSGISVFLQAFFDAKAQELANTMIPRNNPEVIKNLKYLDPSNSMIYNGMR